MSRVILDITNITSSSASAQTGELASNQPPSVESGSHHSRAHLFAVIRESGLFEFDYYRSAHGLSGSDNDLIEHYLDAGAVTHNRPNPYFESAWYLQRYPDIKPTEVHPFVHFILHGDQEGRWPGPLFNNPWYREQHSLSRSVSALGHYMRHRREGSVSPIPEFDIAYYAKHCPDVIAAKIDPFEHFVAYGYREGRNPSADFDVKWYAERYLGGVIEPNPFYHWLANKGTPGIHGRFPDDEPTVAREVRKFARAAAEFEELRPVPSSAVRKAKVLAYYLPQFHAFPENDRWWGKGFTEWTNLPRGLPRFKGHYQPRIPRDLGFYRLDDDGVAATLRRQIDMASASGVHGFVFYHYWFNRRRLMAGPLEHLMSDPSLDFPFCLMWANENWTRRWDGADSEVLISQDYKVEDDPEMLADFARHFKDPRYIRIDGRPLFMIYRPGIIPQAAATIARWRAYWRETFNEDPILVMAQAFGDTDPTPFGLDGAIEFPPHKLTQTLPPINSELKLLDPEFSGKAYRYETVVNESVNEPVPAFPQIKTVVPSWDNDARRQGSGLVLTGSTPAQYEHWLTTLIDRAQKNPFFGEPFVCVNAWNEWCEGAYLEPDVHFGAAYLNATGRAVIGVSASANSSDSKLVLVGHDAFPSGAQRLLLNIGRLLKAQHGVSFEYLLLDGGQLVPDYEAIAPTTVLAGGAGLSEATARLAKRGFTHALVNTTASGQAASALSDRGMHTVLLVHELPRLLREKGLHEAARHGIRSAAVSVFPAEYVRDADWEELGLEEGLKVKSRIMPQGSYQSITPSPEAAAAFRRDLRLGEDDPIVLGIGYADLRKGVDLFIQLWRKVNQTRRVHFCWLGDMDPDLKRWMESDIAIGSGLGTLHLPGAMNVVPALSAASVFALTSREDPFPTVALEALEAGLPVVAFTKSGGIPELLNDSVLGSAVPYGDVEAMAREVLQLFDDPSDEAATKRRSFVQQNFSFPAYVTNLLQLALPQMPRISVVVPNYNYARYMAERLGSIFKQTHPVYEILVLDDCSTDDSLDVIPAIAADWKRQIKVVPNKKNSGSVFAQWRKAAEMATGDWLWIAEADDSSNEEFLEKAMAVVGNDQDVDMVFTDSRTIHIDGTPQWDSYKSYYATVEPNALTESGIWDGHEFIARYLSVKNLILNVSAVVWRRKSLLGAISKIQPELLSLRMAGDWRLYLEVLARRASKISYQVAPLNVHRRHANSVTHSLAVDAHLKEIEGCQRTATHIISVLPKHILSAQSAYLHEVTRQLRPIKKSMSSRKPPKPKAKSGAKSKKNTELNSNGA